MSFVLQVTLAALLTGVIGTGLGGIIALFFGTRGKRAISFIMEFSAGLMLAVVCFELLPEAAELASLPVLVIGFSFGVVLAIFLQDIIKKDAKVGSREGFLGTGFVIMAGIALHNFPEGLAVGAGFEVSLGLGVALAIVIFLHDVPEGLAMALPLKVAKYPPLKIVLYTALTGVPMGIGAFIGAFVGHISESAIAMALSCAAGAMLYIVCGDILPESKRLYNGRSSAVGNVLGFICGMAVSVLIT